MLEWVFGGVGEFVACVNWDSSGADFLDLLEGVDFSAAEAWAHTGGAALALDSDDGLKADGLSLEVVVTTVASLTSLLFARSGLGNNSASAVDVSTSLLTRP